MALQVSGQLEEEAAGAPGGWSEQAWTELLESCGATESEATAFMAPELTR